MDSYGREYKKLTIRTTDGETIHGKVNLSAGERISDIFTKGDTPFVVIIDVVSRGEFIKQTEKILFVNKNHIIWAEPGD